METLAQMASPHSRVRHWIGIACIVVVMGSGAYSFINAIRQQSRYKAQLAGMSERSLAIHELIESDGYGLAVVDQMGKIKEWNPALAEWSNWPVDKAMGNNIEEVMEEPFKSQHAKAFLSAMNKARKDISTGELAKKAPVTVAYCTIIPKGEKPPVPVRVTVRVVESPKGPYAIAIVDKQQRVKLLDAPSMGTPKSAKVEKQMMEQSRGD